MHAYLARSCSGFFCFVLFYCFVLFEDKLYRHQFPLLTFLFLLLIPLGCSLNATIVFIFTEFSAYFRYYASFQYSIRVETLWAWVYFLLSWQISSPFSSMDQSPLGRKTGRSWCWVNSVLESLGIFFSWLQLATEAIQCYFENSSVAFMHI